MSVAFQCTVHDSTTLLVKDLTIHRRARMEYHSDLLGEKITLPGPYESRPIKFGSTCVNNQLWFYIKRTGDDYLKVGTFEIQMAKEEKRLNIPIVSNLIGGPEFIGGRVDSEDLDDFVNKDGSLHYMVKFLNGITFDQDYQLASSGLNWQDKIAASFESGLGADTVLAVGGKTIKVSKYVLSVNSEVFKKIFDKNERKDAGDEPVTIDDMDFEANEVYEVMLALVKRIYGVEVKLEDVTFALKLIIAADKFEVSNVKDEAVKFVKNKLTNDTVVETLVLADQLGVPELMKAAMSYVHPLNIGKLSELPGIEDAPKEIVLLMAEHLFDRVKLLV